jgi:hypothetical protein
VRFESWWGSAGTGSEITDRMPKRRSLEQELGSTRNNREHVAVEPLNNLQFPTLERKQR